MDTVPVRKRKADDDQQQPLQAMQAQDPQQPPRLSLQTQAPSSPASWPHPLPIPLDPLDDDLALPMPTAQSPRVKRPRIDPDVAQVSAVAVALPVAGPPSPSSEPASATSPVASPSATTPVASSSSPPSSPNSRKKQSAASLSARRASDALLSDLHTTHGRRWEWRTVQPGETRLVATFRPASHFTKPSDILRSQSAPTSPAEATSPHRVPVAVVLPIDPNSPHIPPRQPTINRDTLRELDMDSILRNPQLRHDFLFDPGLQFRASQSRRKREQAEAYWAALARELATGCTCVTFDTHGRPMQTACVCRRVPAPPDAPLVACLPHRHRLTLRMPSRLRPALTELLAVLQSVLAAPAPRDRARDRDRADTARMLADALDADLICQQVAHRAFDPARTFAVVGAVLKDHCAPMRDAAVDAMVDAGRVDAVRALRACFEILELMKLDIANHQMQTLRPHIVQCAPRFELSVFAERHRTSPPTITQSWLSTSYKSLLDASYTPPARAPFTSSPHPTRISLACVRGLVDLVFSPPEHYPETLHLDSARLVQLAKDAADLSALYLLLLLFAQLRGPAASRDDRPARHLKAELRDLWPPGLGRVFVPACAGAPPPTGLPALVLQLAARAAEAREPTAAADDGEGEEEEEKSRALPGPPPPALLALAERWVASHLSLTSPLAQLARKRLHAAVLDAAVRTLSSSSSSAPASAPACDDNDDDEPATHLPTNTQSDREEREERARLDRAGLGVLVHEVRHVAERLGRLAVLHLGVYREVYEGAGFVAGP